MVIRSAKQQASAACFSTIVSARIHETTIIIRAIHHWSTRKLQTIPDIKMSQPSKAMPRKTNCATRDVYKP